MPEYVSVESDASVATIRLDRPPVNALNRQMQEEIGEAALEVSRRGDVRAVVLFGGPKVFAAGADVKQMAEWSPVDAAREAPRLQQLFTSVARIPKPVVAAITGYALGGGLELAMTADLRVCGDNAQLGQPEIKLGLIPGAGGTQRLARLVGPARAKELVYSGRFVGAEEARAMGLVDRVVAPDDVLGAALELAQQFATGPTRALAAAKQAIDDGLEGSLESGLRLESTVFAGLFATEDTAIGMSSYLEHGPGKARFTGQ